MQQELGAAVPDSATTAGLARGAAVEALDVWTRLGLLAVAVAVVAGLFVASMLYYTRGHLSTPLDDTQIYFQYARQIAHGHIMVYEDGAQATSGSTSFLYPFVLGAGYLAGFRDQQLVLWGLLLNAACLAAVAVLCYALVRRLVEDVRAAYVAAALVVVSGWLGWTFLAMMETGIHTALLLAALYAIVRAKEDASWMRWLAAALALLALTRPEMTLLAVFIGAAWWFDAYVDAGRRLQMRALAPVGAALAATVAYFAVMVALTGSARTNTFVVQSVFTSQTPTTFAIADKVATSFMEHVRFAFTWFGPSYLGTIAFALCVLGAVSLVADDVAARRATWRSMLPAVLLVGLLSASLVRHPTTHMHRWAAPYAPLIIVLTVSGAWQVARLVEGARPMLMPLAAVLIGGSILAAVPAINEYGENTSDIYFQQTAAAAWIRANTPAGAVVGINDAGALTYHGRRTTLDLVGLTSRDIGDSYRQGGASVLEYIERLPESERPSYYAIYPEWFSFSDATVGFLTPMTNFLLERPTISGGTNMVVYRAEPSVLNTGELPRELPPDARGWTVADSVDVADLASENAHGYATASREVGIAPAQVVVRRTYASSQAGVLDGGRVVLAGERLRLRLRDASKPWVVLSRASAPFGTTMSAGVADTRQDIAVPPDGTAWRDTLIARGAGGGPAEITVDAVVTGAAYSSYHYWLLQPE